MVVFELTRPMYSSIVFEGSPAASTRVGCSITFAMGPYSARLEARTQDSRAFVVLVKSGGNMERGTYPRAHRPHISFAFTTPRA